MKITYSDMGYVRIGGEELHAIRINCLYEDIINLIKVLGLTGVKDYHLPPKPEVPSGRVWGTIASIQRFMENAEALGYTFEKEDVK